MGGHVVMVQHPERPHVPPELLHVCERPPGKATSRLLRVFLQRAPRLRREPALRLVFAQVDVTKSYFRRKTLRAMGGKDEDGTPNIVVDPPTGRVKETVPTPAESLEMTGHLEREDMPRWAALDAKARVAVRMVPCVLPASRP